MNFQEYQDEAAKTDVYPSTSPVEYAVVGVANEAGELLGKMKKKWRGDYDDDDVYNSELISEAGDVLWYLAKLARALDISLEDIAKTNIEKLRFRAEKGSIKGSGDNR